MAADQRLAFGQLSKPGDRLTVRMERLSLIAETYRGSATTPNDLLKPVTEDDTRQQNSVLDTDSIDGRLEQSLHMSFRSHDRLHTYPEAVWVHNPANEYGTLGVSLRLPAFLFPQSHLLQIDVQA